MYEQNKIRGQIINIERYKQLISYEGLERHRHITPTDIDGVIDYAGNAFLYLECKHESKYFQFESTYGMDKGQKIAIENIINSHRIAYKLAVAIIFTHDCDPDKIIIAKDMQVRAILDFDFKWRYAKDGFTVLKAIGWFEGECKRKNTYI